MINIRIVKQLINRVEIALIKYFIVKATDDRFIDLSLIALLHAGVQMERMNRWLRCEWVSGWLSKPGLKQLNPRPSCAKCLGNVHSSAYKKVEIAIKQGITLN